MNGVASPNTRLASCFHCLGLSVPRVSFIDPPWHAPILPQVVGAKKRLKRDSPTLKTPTLLLLLDAEPVSAFWYLSMQYALRYKLRGNRLERFQVDISQVPAAQSAVVDVHRRSGFGRDANPCGATERSTHDLAIPVFVNVISHVLTRGARL
jgi:hypothetical protein